MSGQQQAAILDCVLHKLPLSYPRKSYRVTLTVPDNGIPIIEYCQAKNSNKPKKSIQFGDLLFADRKHDITKSCEKFAFSIYTIDKTTTFLAKDETMMNEWLAKIRECHSSLYPEFKRYDFVFEVSLMDIELAKTMNIKGPYRLALSKESVDLIPLLTGAHLLPNSNATTNTTSTATTTTTSSSTAATTVASTVTTTNPSSSATHHQLPLSINETIPKLPNAHHIQSTINLLNSKTTISGLPHHQHFPQHLPSHQRFHKRHPLLSSKTIELVLRSIRRCGHTDCNFFIELGRHSQIGEGGLWMRSSNKSTARQLHELLLATMKNASSSEDQFLYKPPRSRSGSSSENANRSQRSRSSSLVCLTSETIPMSSGSSAGVVIGNNNNIDEDSGYLPMA